jgi:integrase
MRGDGSVSKYQRTVKGKTYIYLRYQYLDNDGNKHEKLFPDNDAGQKKLDKFIRETRQKKDNDQLHYTGYTVGSWLKAYLKTYVKNNVRDTSFLRILQAGQKLESLKDVPLDKLKAHQVQELYNRLSIDLSPSSVLKVHRLLSASYRKAQAVREITYNPMLAVTPPKQEQKKDKEIFTSLELLQIFKAIKRIEQHPSYKSVKHDYYTLFLLLLTTGMRIGELLALRWEDVDLKKRMIHVHATASHKDIHQPKTASGDRMIPILFDTVLRRLKALRKADGTIRLTGYVFSTRSGKNLSYQMVLKQWQAICKHSAGRCKHCGSDRPTNWLCSCGNVVKRNGNKCSVCGSEQPTSWLCSCGTVNKEITKSIHCFRHTFASIMLSAKQIPIKEVSAILGHAQTSTTVDMYYHSLPNYTEKLIQQFSRTEKRKIAK